MTIRPRRQTGWLLVSWLSRLWLLPLLAALLLDCRSSLWPSEIELSADAVPLDVAPGGLIMVTLRVGCNRSFLAGVDIETPARVFEGELPTRLAVPCTQATADSSFREGTVRLDWRVRSDASPGFYDIDFSIGSRSASLRLEVRLSEPGPGPEPEPPPAAAGWQPLGGVVNLDEPSNTTGPAVVLDTAGRPLAAWVENQRVVVRRWDGSAWQTLAPLPPSAEAQDTPALALASDGAPVVAWTERRSSATESTRVQVRRWDGAAWQALGPSSVEAGDAVTARSPALLSAGGPLVLAWAEETAATDHGGRLQVRRWDGSAWVDAVPAGPLPAPGQPDEPRLARLPDGRLAVAWRNVLGGTVQVALAGDSWSSIGGFAAANSVGLALLHAPAEGLLLVVPPSVPAPQFSVRRWTGSEWLALGEPQGLVATGAGVSHVALATSGTEARPVLAWIQFTTSQRDFRVRRWDGSSWVTVGDPLPPLARTSPGTPWGLALAGAATPVLATGVSQFAPGGGSDIAIRVREFR